MTLFKDKYKIDSLRLKNWDYSSEGIYFITLVTQNRECIFGSVEEEEMILNDNGKIIEKELLKSISIRKNWFFHNWIVMPNHIHLLIEIQSSNTNIAPQQSVEAHCSASPQAESTTDVPQRETPSISATGNITETHCSAPLRNNQMENTMSRKPNSISSFVAIFKSITTKQINGVSSIWQSNYHDHIVRNYHTFDKIYHYIKNNPRNWNIDSINIDFQ
ncbi:transposase [Flavobacterium sp. MC2016-06]|uniref:transposase n=1 Tax=Flavobacterium sp. MC2016-06 TaxID=2676308 RepID=UPI0012BAAA92|nr:transposase [Flavobacterium sp. MC2016-06]MBU3857809.1 transposase [Flavobacterium sp. MC2016-06]